MEDHQNICVIHVQGFSSRKGNLGQKGISLLPAKINSQYRLESSVVHSVFLQINYKIIKAEKMLLEYVVVKISWTSWIFDIVESRSRPCGTFRYFTLFDQGEGLSGTSKFCPSPVCCNTCQVL